MLDNVEPALSVDSGNVGPKMLGDVGATMLDDETFALSMFLILNLIIASIFMKQSLSFTHLDR